MICDTASRNRKTQKIGLCNVQQPKQIDRIVKRPQKQMVAFTT